MNKLQRLTLIGTLLLTSASAFAGASCQEFVNYGKSNALTPPDSSYLKSNAANIIACQDSCSTLYNPSKDKNAIADTAQCKQILNLLSFESSAAAFGAYAQSSSSNDSSIFSGGNNNTGNFSSAFPNNASGNTAATATTNTPSVAASVPDTATTAINIQKPEIAPIIPNSATPKTKTKSNIRWF